MNKSYKIQNLESSTTYYYVIEKDFEIVRQLTEKLNSRSFYCLGVSLNANDLMEIIEGMLIRPSIIFIGIRNITKEIIDKMEIYANKYLFKILLIDSDLSSFRHDYNLEYSVVAV